MKPMNHFNADSHSPAAKTYKGETTKQQTPPQQAGKKWNVTISTKTETTTTNQRKPDSTKK
jgi:hypothetical protein